MTLIDRYGVKVTPTSLPISTEMWFISKGGNYTQKNGKLCGKGIVFHAAAAIKEIWPFIVFHKWLDLVIENYWTHRTLIIIGPASSGKTLGAALCLLLDFYCHPSMTTTIICSTTRERLEDRIWGELKRLHRAAIDRFSFLPGHLIEGKQRLVADDRSMAEEGRDFRNGIVGVACKQGGDYQGLGDFVGIKNKRVRLLGDELSLLPRVFVDAISNLDKNPDFKCIGLGNPKDITDALGVLAEPAAHLGGWDGQIDQTPKTKTWEIRRPNGVCVQLVGTDSPNLDGKLGIPLITQEQIDRDVAFYGRDSMQFSMMCQGMMPRGQGSRRVMTRQFCLQHGAMEEPRWLNANRTKIAFLDAAYRGVGGDRCVFGWLEFGPESAASPEQLAAEVAQALVTQQPADNNSKVILALMSLDIVPIKPGDFGTPEDQIVAFVQSRCESLGIVPENFFFDAGMRTSLVTAFGRIWTPKVTSIDCGGKPTERQVSHDLPVTCRDYYSKFISELWYSVRMTVEANQFRGLTEDVMMEFSAREFGMVSGNRIEVEPKEKMKEKTGRSPDLADAVAIGVEGARQRGFVIRRIANPNARRVKVDHAWKRELREKARALRESHSLNYSA